MDFLWRATMPNGLVRPMTAEEIAKRGWQLYLNGELVPDVASARLVQPKMGIELAYGMRPEGFDGPVITEPGGGGSVIVPFTERDGKLYIGMVEQKRPLQGGVVLNVPRGFLRPDENHFQAANREATDETAYVAANLELFELFGDGVNPNNAFFNTNKKGMGVRFFALKVPEQHINWTPGDSPLATFKEGVLKTDPASSAAKVAEGILKCRFQAWWEATLVGDMFTLAAIARLQAFLHVTKGH